MYYVGICGETWGFFLHLYYILLVVLLYNMLVKNYLKITNALPTYYMIIFLLSQQNASKNLYKKLLSTKKKNSYYIF